MLICLLSRLLPPASRPARWAAFPLLLLAAGCLTAPVGYAQGPGSQGVEPITEHKSLRQALLTAIAAGDAGNIVQTSRMVIATALRQLAQGYAARGDHAEAAGLYKSALATEPSHEAQLDLAGELLASGDAETGRSLASDVLGAEPGNSRALAISKGQPDPGTPPPSAVGLSLATEGALRRILAEAYTDWGTAVIQQQGDFKGAFLLFQAATHWDPTAAGAMQNLGMAAFRLGDYSASVSALRSALLVQPGNSQASLLLGLSEFSLQQFKEAAATFATIPKQTEADNHAAYAWAFSLAHTSQPLEANRILDEIVNRAMPAENRLLVCQVYEQTENYEHAVSCLQKTAGEDPSLRTVHSSTGISLIHMSRPADAIPELRTELAGNPSDLDAQFYLAYALVETSQKEEAQRLLNGVVTRQPGNGEAQYQLGKLLAEQSQWPQAIEHLKAAAAAEPANYDIHYQLQNCYRRNGQAEDAARELAIYKSIKSSTRRP